MILLSASSIKDFLACERKYWYRRYASKLAVPNEYLIRGRVVHEVIEKYWDDSSAGLMYLNTLDDGTFNMDKADLHIKMFYNNFSNLLSENDLIEYKFKVKYDEDVYFIGKFDWIIQGTGVVIDWKTNRSTPKDISKDPQFLLYYYAYTQLFNSPPSSVYFASLTRGKFVKFNFSQRNLDILLGDIIPDMLEHINEDKFQPSGLFKNVTCKFCSFREHCHDKLGLENFNELDSTEFNFR